MSEIKLSYAEVRDNANNLHSIANNIKSSLDNIASIKDRIPDSWEGVASDSYTANLGAIVQSFESVYMELENCCAFMVQAADAYDQVDKNIEAQFFGNLGVSGYGNLDSRFFSQVKIGEETIYGDSKGAESLNKSFNNLKGANNTDACPTVARNLMSSRNAILPGGSGANGKDLASTINNGGIQIPDNKEKEHIKITNDNGKEKMKEALNKGDCDFVVSFSQGTGDAGRAYGHTFAGYVKDGVVYSIDNSSWAGSSVVTSGGGLSLSVNDVNEWVDNCQYFGSCVAKDMVIITDKVGE